MPRRITLSTRLAAMGAGATALAAALVAPSFGIVGGADSFPQAPVGRIIVNAGTGTMPECTTELIAAQYVMTSASCLVLPNAAQIAAAGMLTVKLGEQAMGQGGESFTVTKVMTPTNWKAAAPTATADLAVLKLNAPSAATPLTVGGPAPMPGQVMALYGWGATTNTPGNYAVKLQTTSGVGVDPAATTCTTVNNTFFCEDPIVQNTGACFGDGGTPVMVNGMVTGVLSGPDPANTPNPVTGPSCLGRYRATLTAGQAQFIMKATAGNTKVVPAA